MMWLPSGAPRTMYDGWIDAPAELPPTTPPRSSTPVSSRSVRVPRYVSASRHWRPPGIHTPVAARSGAANRSVSATRESRVCSTVMLRAPASRNGRRPAQSSGYSSCSPAVGITTMRASAPPASWTKRCMMSGPRRPPPAMTSVPLGGPSVFAGPRAPSCAATGTVGMVRSRAASNAHVAPG